MNTLQLISNWIENLNKGDSLDRSDLLSLPALAGFYKPEEIWLDQAIYSCDLKEAQFLCRVPMSHYTLFDQGHVAAEQYVRVYNQACFVLAQLLAKDSKTSELEKQLADEPHYFYLVDYEPLLNKTEKTGVEFTINISYEKAYKFKGVTYFRFSVKRYGKSKKFIVAYVPPSCEQVHYDPSLHDSLLKVWTAWWAELPRIKLNFTRLIAKLRIAPKDFKDHREFSNILSIPSL